MFKSIKIRLTVTICGILLFVFSVQMAGNFLFAQRYYEYTKTQMMKDAFYQIKQQTETTEDSLEDIIRGLDVDRNLEFLLADSNMNIIYTNKEIMFMPDPRMKGNDFDFNKYPISYYTTDKPTVLKSDMADGDRIRLLSKIERKGVTYYLAIRLSVQAIGKEMKSTYIFISYLSTFAMVAGGLFVYGISRRLAKPIEAVNKVAIDVSNLDFSSRAVETGRKDEIGSLATNINIMADRLERDIKSLQEANKKLEDDNEYMNKVDEQRKEFIANISHELKTPLAILTGYAEMLDNDVPGIDKTFYYETILDETRKMDILIKNLLNLSNMENSLAQLNMEEINIEELTERIFRKNSVLMKNKEITGEFTSKPCRRILGDALYLEEAINNYLSNAISYTEKGHTIRVNVEPVNGEAVVRIFNEGINIEEAHVEKIWNSFYREDKSRTRTSQNNIGLGLYIVRSIMNAHHGKCGVSNKENGVEFWLSVKEIETETAAIPDL